MVRLDVLAATLSYLAKGCRVLAVLPRSQLCSPTELFSGMFDVNLFEGSILINALRCPDHDDDSNSDLGNLAEV